MRLIPLFLLTLAACTGTTPDDTGETDDSEDTSDSESEDTDQPDQFTSDWQGVKDLVAARCTNCHGFAEAALVLPDAIEADIRSGAGELVVAGDPSASTLWRVLSGEVVEGDYGVMPLGTGPLPEFQVRHVRAWILEGAPLEPLPDADGDGFRADVDCDDDDATANPGATEACNGKDDDCDGDTDEPDAADAGTFYTDADADGFGDDVSATTACAAEAGQVAQGGDCDDAAVSVNPDALERCNGDDDDCDGETDEPDGEDVPVWYVDGDGDGFAETEEGAVTACTDPSTDDLRYAPDLGDCDDADPAFFPGAVEEDCTDPADYNCDGTSGAVDGDGDGFFACEECDDTNAAVHPDAEERCNTIEDNCDGLIDDPGSVDAQTWFADGDNDGYGAGAPILACAKPSGAVDNNDDCDDNNASARPGLPERCNGFDDDCDGVNNEDDATDAPTWVVDADNDGFGAIGGATRRACARPSGFAALATDCNDGNAAVNPNALDNTTNGIDDDCDGRVDDNAPGAPPYWEIDVQPLLQNRGCIGCHGFTRDGLLSRNGPGGTKFITPGNTAQSYVWHKINGTQASVGGSGSQMPPSGPLSSGDIDLIRRWIEAGAPN